MKIKSWSYSQLSSYEQCPHQHMYKRIIKLPEPPSYALTNGVRIHQLAEDYLTGKLIELPDELARFNNEFNNLKAAGAQAELAQTYDVNWKLITSENAWDCDEAWLRLKIDAAIPGLLIDFKTGKQYPEHKKQGQLYADAAMMNDGSIDEIDVEFWYLNSGKVVSHVFNREGLDARIKEWKHKVLAMHNDDTFTPRQHEWCKYCYVKQFCPAYK